LPLGFKIVKPNRAGPFGLFQPLADGLFSKEEFEPKHQTDFLFCGPALLWSTALMTSAVTLGRPVAFFGRIFCHRLI
jgi:NADH-quinone oxidoreductase subunit H